MESKHVLPVKTRLRCLTGDLRRALAAAERLCILLGDRGPLERRDVAVLYLHAGDIVAAKVHLDAYSASEAARGAQLSRSMR
jgi:hypothetical protein